jgi:4-hydroxybenzoate polyprenyltransferase
MLPRLSWTEDNVCAESVAMMEAADRTSVASPLCVDLDGTLVHTNLLYENLIAMLTAKPWLAVFLPLWLLKGRAYFKMRIADHAVLDPALLPYDERVLDYLHREKEQGRVLILATASIQSQAQAIADHLGLFDAVFASGAGHNLKGSAKASLLREKLGRFSYIGNAHGDTAVWNGAETVGIANAPRKLARFIAADHVVEVEIPRRHRSALTIIKALRPHQWAKNLLVFVPILTANHLSDPAAWAAALLAFVAFSFTASGIYVLNDLTDLAADRRHLRKRHRAFASGMVPVPLGMALGPVLLVLGLAIAWVGGILSALAFYGAVSLSYTLRAKELPLVDVFCLSFLYVARLFAGGLATGFHVSQWLVGFSTFFFLGLAFIKRVAELSTAQRDSKKVSRRGYLPEDVTMLNMMGVSSSFISCVLLALFVQSPEVAARYASPATLWLLVPLILFWQLRLWLSTTRGYMLDDPIVYGARDWVSWVTFATVVAIMILANHSFLW